MKTKSKEKNKRDIPDELPVKSLKSMNKHRSFVFYGRAGSGKTTLACSFPQPVLLVDINDKGTDSVEDYEIDEVAGHTIDTWEDFEDLYYYLVANPKRYKTVVLDTMTQLQTLCQNYVLEKKKKNNKDVSGWGVMTRQEWGEVAGLMKQWITSYRDLPMEVVFIAQDRVFNSDEESDAESMLAPEVGARLSPSIVSHLNAAVSVVANTFIRQKTILVKDKATGKKKEKVKKVYCLRIGPDSTYITKVRKPKAVVLPDFLENADYDLIIETLKGE